MIFVQTPQATNITVTVTNYASSLTTSRESAMNASISTVAIGTLDQAIAQRTSRPKGVKVGVELGRALVASGRVTSERGYIGGVIDSELDFPVLDRNIFVHVDPTLDDYECRLPSQ